MNTYPVNLLLRKRRCLVVGAGKVASRKLDGLLAAEADVTVVAPRVSSTVRRRHGLGEITLCERGFEPGDLEGMFLVYAATDDRALNQMVVQAAEAAGVLACSVDRNWRDGAFITPACVVCDNMTVAVSSHGTACRRSRLVKENLERHLKTMGNLTPLVLGVDHRTMPAGRRERLHLHGPRLERAGAMLKRLWGMQEFMLLSTCNRVELVAISEVSESMVEMLKMILGMDGCGDGAVYVKAGDEAFEHLCLVAAGMLSQAPGETRIVNQFKAAFDVAAGNGWAGSLLESLRNLALQVSRRIRNRVGEGFDGADVEGLLAAFLGRRAGMAGKRALIAGTGDVGAGVKRLLLEAGCRVDWLYHREPPRSEEGVAVSQLSALPGLLPLADLVVMALSVDAPALTGEHASCFKPGALVVDLGIPRNVAPELGVEDVVFADLDTLKQTNPDLALAMDMALEVVGEHREDYERFVDSFIRGDQGQQAVQAPV